MVTRYTEEFREEAVRLVLESKSSMAKVAEDLGVNTWTLRGWVKKYREGIRASEPRRHETLEEENRRLKREIAVLRQERDISKKSGGVLCEGAADKVRLRSCSRRRVPDEVDVPCAEESQEAATTVGARRRAGGEWRTAGWYRGSKRSTRRAGRTTVLRESTGSSGRGRVLQQEASRTADVGRTG